MRVYGIGDVHGHLGKLQEAHALIEKDRALTGDREAPVVHVGDLTDRGPDSRGVIGYLMEGIAREEPWRVIKGNHDRMFTGFMADPRSHDPLLRRDLTWLHPRLGGAATLASYGVADAYERDLDEVHAEARDKVDPAHLRFLEELPLFDTAGALLFVHAGIRPGVALSDQAEDDLLWIREGFLEDTRDHGPLVVHGHTSIENVTHYGNRVNLDGGAGYGRALEPVVFEGRHSWILTPSGRVELLPPKIVN